MKDTTTVAVHKETGSVARNVNHLGAGYVIQECDKDYSEYLILRFERIEDHRASSTVWFREVSYDKYDDYYHVRDDAREFPMRVREFTRLLLEGRNMLKLEGFFGFSKQGSAVAIVALNDGYGD